MPGIAAERYWSHDFMRREWSHMWRRVWLLVGHASDVASDGDWMTAEVGLESLLVVRDGGGVRAYHNVCPHRGSVLCDGARGRAEGGAIRCGYHGWEWALDGSLRKAPGAGRLPTERPHLTPLRCELRAGFVFVSLDPEPEALDDYLGPLGPRLDAYGAGRYVRVGMTALEVPCNWKVSTDVSNEAYHLRAVHPELLGWADVDAVKVETMGRHSHVSVRMVGPSREAAPSWPPPDLVSWARAQGVDGAARLGPEALRAALAAAARARAAREGTDLSGLDDDQLVDRNQFHVFPNVQLNFFTARHIDLYRHRPRGDDPERSVFEWERFDLPSPGDKPRLTTKRGRPGDFDVGAVMQADLDVLPRLQRGLRSSSMTTFLTTPLERPIAHMHAVLGEYVGDPPEAR